VFVAGSTDSTNFPGTTGGAQPASGGLNDAFVARLTADLTGVAQPTPTTTPVFTATATPPIATPTVTPPIGPGPATEIPMLSPGLLALFALALAGAAIFLIRRA
jgi:hypothetical protein